MARLRFTIFRVVILAFGLAGSISAAPPEVRVIVALANNPTQGIIPVPARIENGDDATSNLYWGASA